MKDLDKALGDISSIRRLVAQSTEFRGYGPTTLAVTGLIAGAAAVGQSIWLPQPVEDIYEYLAIWISTAGVSGALIATQMWTRSRRMHSDLAADMIRMAVEQFLPSVFAGAALTVVLALLRPDALWLMPGLWQIIFALGVFSSCRFLPRPMLSAGAWYLLTGLGCVALGDARAFSPWAMGIPFGIGQLLVAAVLYFRAPEAEL